MSTICWWAVLDVKTAQPTEGQAGAHHHPLVQRVLETAPLCLIQIALWSRRMAFLSLPSPVWACRPSLLCFPLPALLLLPSWSQLTRLLLGGTAPPPSSSVRVDIPSSRRPQHRSQLSQGELVCWVWPSFCGCLSLQVGSPYQGLVHNWYGNHNNTIRSSHNASE